MIRRRELFGVYKERDASGLEGREHSGDVRDLDLAGTKLDLLLPQQKAVGEGRVGVLQLVVVQLRDVLFADRVYQEWGGESEEGEKDASAQDQAKVLSRLRREQKTGYSVISASATENIRMTSFLEFEGGIPS